jgi:hypothetical protein
MPSKTHDQQCLDSNRFGDGFDCNCEPNWKALYQELQKKLKAVEDALEATKTMHQMSLQETVDAEMKLEQLEQQSFNINKEAITSLNFLAKLGYQAKATDQVDAGLISGLLGTLARIRDLTMPVTEKPKGTT